MVAEAIRGCHAGTAQGVGSHPRGQSEAGEALTGKEDKTALRVRNEERISGNGVVCPSFGGGGLLDSAVIIVKGDDMARRGYPSEFRRRVVELVEGGRKVAEVAADLEISEQTIYTWRRQARIDAGLEVGLTTSEQAELAAAKRRIRELETELAIHRRAGPSRRSSTRRETALATGWISPATSPSTSAASCT